MYPLPFLCGGTSLLIYVLRVWYTGTFLHVFHLRWYTSTALGTANLVQFYCIPLCSVQNVWGHKGTGEPMYECIIVLVRSDTHLVWKLVSHCITSLVHIYSVSWCRVHLTHPRGVSQAQNYICENTKENIKIETPPHRWPPKNTC